MRVQLGGEDWGARYSAQARAGEGGERMSPPAAPGPRIIAFTGDQGTTR
jgi:hypothetical protein